MKTICIAFLLIVLEGCNQNQNKLEESNKMIPPVCFIERTDSALKNINGIWFYRNQNATGYILEKKKVAVISKVPVIDGRENGVAYGWFESGEIRYERSYKNGNRDGLHKIWYKNGQLANNMFYIDDKLEGEQKSYFESGNRWQILNYKHGYEDGKQKTWDDSGKVINNFTVKNGKLYGVIGRYDCMSVMQK